MLKGSICSRYVPVVWQWIKIVTFFLQMLLRWILMLTRLISSCDWQMRTGRLWTPHPGSTRTRIYLSALRTGARFWPQRASIWAGTTLRQTSAVRAHTSVWRTRASIARATRATAASQETTSPGVFSGTDAPSPRGTVALKPLSMWRSSLVLECMWTTHRASWLSMEWMTTWRSSTKTRQSSWSLFIRPSGCPRRRMLLSWLHLESQYGSKAPLLLFYTQTRLLLPEQATLTECQGQFSKMKVLLRNIHLVWIKNVIKSAVWSYLHHCCCVSYILNCASVYLMYLPAYL